MGEKQMRRDEILCAISDFERQRKEAQGQVEALDDVIQTLNNRPTEMVTPVEPVIKKSDILAHIEGLMLEHGWLLGMEGHLHEKGEYTALRCLLDWVKQK